MESPNTSKLLDQSALTYLSFCPLIRASLVLDEMLDLLSILHLQIEHLIQDKDELIPKPPSFTEQHFAQASLFSCELSDEALTQLIHNVRDQIVPCKILETLKSKVPCLLSLVSADVYQGLPGR